MKKVLTYGTFDLLHVGHINLLRRARELGDFLIVGLSTADFNLMKRKESFLPYDQRKVVLESLEYVDLVIPETSWEQKIGDVKKYSIDVFVMGNDWEGHYDFLKEYCEVIYLKRTENISTTQLKEVIKKRLLG